VTRLTETGGLTELQRDILAAVREFVDAEILPVATELDHADAYPHQIVAGAAEARPVRAGHRPGIRRPRRVPAHLRPGGEEIARGWMSISGIINTHFVVSHIIGQHGTDEQKAYFLPKMAAGETRGAISLLIGEGTAEIQKMIIGNRLIEKYRIS
jgi:alkylation response protein AidB-like acyl-CoA dehydrogenase